MAWATQVQSPKLSSEGKDYTKSSKWDHSVLLLVPLPAVLLCTSYYITLEALIYLNPLVSHTTLINSLTYLLSSPLHPYLL